MQYEDDRLYWLDKLCVPQGMQTTLIDGCHYSMKQESFVQLWGDLITHCAFADEEAAQIYAARVIPPASWSL